MHLYKYKYVHYKIHTQSSDDYFIVKSKIYYINPNNIGKLSSVILITSAVLILF